MRMHLGLVASAGRVFEGDSVGFLDPREAARPSLEVRVPRSFSPREYLYGTYVRTPSNV